MRVVDARAFYAALKRYGSGGEGASRGYIETEDGSISIEKYFVHLDCYVPIKAHPYTKDHFDIKTVKKPHHKAAFDAWLAERARGSSGSASKSGGKKGAKKKTNDEDDDDKDEKKTKVMRKKKIAKKT